MHGPAGSSMPEEHYGRCNKCAERALAFCPLRGQGQNAFCLTIRTKSSIIVAMYRVTKCISFCYGHRLPGYPGKCRHLHGHNARAMMTLEEEVLDELASYRDQGHVEFSMPGSKTAKPGRLRAKKRIIKRRLFVETKSLYDSTTST